MIALLLAGALSGACFDTAGAASTGPTLARPRPTEWREALTEGDAHYERRGAGASGPVASPREIEAAIAAYRRAVAACPGDATAISSLLRAIFFRGAFTGASRDEQRRLFTEARTLGEDEITQLERGLPSGLERLAALRRVEGAPALYFWSAVSWGQWALASGKLAAVRQGAAARVRDLAQTAIDLDPDYEQGSGFVILGRLHDQTPRIPFLTFWVSRTQALQNLRRAYAISPKNTVTEFFLADAILRHDPKQRAEAQRLLTECANAPPRASHQVEDTHYAAKARERLKETTPSP